MKILPQKEQAVWGWLIWEIKGKYGPRTCRDAARSWTLCGTTCGIGRLWKTKFVGNVNDTCMATAQTGDSHRMDQGSKV